MMQQQSSSNDSGHQKKKILLQKFHHTCCINLFDMLNCSLDFFPLMHQKIGASFLLRACSFQPSNAKRTSCQREKRHHR
jgi:hypothetical protein